MFVIWRRRLLRLKPRWQVDPEARLEARLAESVRVEGKPRQRFIAYLASLAEPNDASDRADFWDVITHELDRLGNRLGDERAKIEAAIAARVPRPTAQERAAYLSRYERWLKRRDEGWAHIRAERENSSGGG
jgi:hypothetical protein